MTTTHVSTIEAKEEFSELINRVAHNNERIVLTRRDKNVAALISWDDFLLLQKIQSQTDLEEAVKALQDARAHGTINLDDLKKEIGT